MIILDEKIYAEDLIKNGSPKPYGRLKDIIILAKYYKYQQFENHEIRKMLEEFCINADKEYNPVLSGWKIDKAINTIKLYRLRTSFPVIVTKSEVEIIKQFNDYRYQKVLFVLIVIAKFFKYSDTRIKPSTRAVGINDFFVNESMRGAVKIARISLRKTSRNKMFHVFHDAGLLDGTAYNSLRIKCIDESSEPEIIVTDFENIILHYMRFCGAKVAGCACGRLFLRNSNRHSMCRKCWKERQREIKREYMKKIRGSLEKQ